MSIVDRIRAQQLRHRQLDQRIRQEEQRAAADADLIRAMKREKLAIRDWLMASQAAIEPAQPPLAASAQPMTAE